MKPLRLKLQDETKLKKLPSHVIEKDYALSYILAGLAQQAALANSLVFKGGTALKKIFFGDYRFSEDLDFSSLNSPQGEKLEKNLKNAMIISKKMLNEYGPFEIQLKRNTERAPHPNGQEAFSALIKFPWQPTALCSIKIEITHDEPVFLKPEYKPIIHGYSEIIDCSVACYHIEEILAEKLRALLQTHKKLITRGWNKPRARDYYDLWHILKNYRSIIDKKRLTDLLNKKCLHREVSYQTIDDFFSPELTREANQHWQATLGGLVKDLPECNLILKETRLLIEEILSGLKVYA